MQRAEQVLAETIGVPFKIDQIELGSYRVNYLRAGTGTPLLLLHGANIGWGQWYPNIGPLAQHFTIYAPDLPGVGGTTRHDFRQLRVDEDFVATMAAFITALGLKSLAIMGHSFGAVVALKLAHRLGSRVTKLILVGPLGFSNYISPKHRMVAIYPLAKLISKTVMSPSPQNTQAFLKENLHKKTSVSQEFIDYYHASVLADKHAHPLLFMNSLTRRLKIKPEAVMVRHLPDIMQPTLIVMGAHDNVISQSNVRQAAHLLPHAQTEIIPDAGHVPNQEQPEGFNRLVINFLGQA